MNHILIKQTVTSAKKVITLMMQVIVDLKTIVILQANAEVLHIAYAIENIAYLKRLLWSCAMDLTTIVILSSEELAKNLSGEFNCLGENIEKYKALSVPITEVKIIDK